jgi:glutathione synthase/RimK-type ligase-like ATP-grasp enzyme
VKDLGLFFGGVDLALVKDRYYFIEVNPTGEWAWLVDAAGLRIDTAICDCLEGVV